MRTICMVYLSVLIFQINILVQDQYNIDEVNISYGSYLEDAYMIITDRETDEVYNEIVLDEGYHESFVYLAEVSNKEFIMVMETYNDEMEDYLYTLLLYNVYGELIHKVDLIEEPISFHNHHHTLIIKTEDDVFYVSNDLVLSENLEIESEVTGQYSVQYQGEAYVNGELVDGIGISEPGIYEIKMVSNDYEYLEYITVHPEIKILGDEYLEGYIGQVQVISTGHIYINEKVFQTGQILETPGLYEVSIFGVNEYVKSFKLYIHPNIVYFDGEDQFALKDGMVFDFPIRLYANVDTMMVNEQLYEGELLSEIGDYSVKLMVDNKVIETINIFIESSIEGVIHQKEYEVVKLYAFGQVFLNNELISGFVYLKEPGTYELKVKNQDETYEEIEFYIIGSNEEEKTSILPYSLLAISLIGLAIILFKK